VGLPGQLQERQLEVLLGGLLVLLGVLLLEVQQQINPVILAEAVQGMETSKH
jgi:hypothetical protein